MPKKEPIKLTALCHGGGCGCKIAPEVLADLLSNSPFEKMMTSELIVGSDTSDDAAVYRLNETQALILTTDFFLPVVDEPNDFGRIAATNAISDIYAMGGTPIMALAIVGMPINTLSVDTIRAILHGGESVCRVAGIPIAGGHSIDSAEPFYGLVVAGIANPNHIRLNSAAKKGDRILLLKPLGVGIYSAALRKNKLTDALYQEMLSVTTMLNSIGGWLGQQKSVHALTDVTGFGLPGHLLELCRASHVSADINWSKLPWMTEAQTFAKQGLITGASLRNWQSYGADINLQIKLETWQRLMLCDPQTSGGLLCAVSPNQVGTIQIEAQKQGFIAADIGKCVEKNQGKSAKEPLKSIINILE